MSERNYITIYVACYILRFPGEDGEWAQVQNKAFRTEQEARAWIARGSGRYTVDSIDVPLDFFPH